MPVKNITPAFHVGQSVKAIAFTNCFGEPVSETIGLTVSEIRLIEGISIAPYFRVKAESSDGFGYVEGAEHYFAAAELPQNRSEWQPTFSAWRHGGSYVDNLRYPSGAVGCVSRNYPDHKWRIACDNRPFDARPTFPNRTAAAFGERDLIARGVN